MPNYRKKIPAHIHGARLLVVNILTYDALRVSMLQLRMIREEKAPIPGAAGDGRKGAKKASFLRTVSERRAATQKR